MKKLLFYLMTFNLYSAITVTDLISQGSTTESNFREITVNPFENQPNKFLIKSEELLFAEHVILDNLNGPNTIAGADFDDDGDVDVVATSFDGNYISWLENDGNQNFASHRFIENFGQPRADVTRLDGDLDYDIIAASQTGDKISWFENDGEANFIEHVIIDNWESAGIVYARDPQRGIDLDINKDGYTDFIATSPAPGNKISWFENDGNQNFIEHVLKENWYWVRRVSAYDIDKDNDMDIVAAAKVGEIIWFENNGEENFTEHIVISNWGEPNAVLVEDINKDGYIDLVATSVVANEVVWFENDGNQNFIKHTIKEQYNGAYGLFISDIDKDSDFDIIATAWIGGFGSVFENDGNQNFTEHIFCNSGYDLLHLFVIDLDKDEDLDILGVCYASNLPQIRWWENSSTVNVEEMNSLPIDFKLLQNYPNPFNPTTKIKYEIPQSANASLKVYDVLGNEIVTLINEEKPAGSYQIEFDGVDLPSGIYFYQLKSNSYINTKKMVLSK